MVVGSSSFAFTECITSHMAAAPNTTCNARDAINVLRRLRARPRDFGCDMKISLIGSIPHEETQFLNVQDTGPVSWGTDTGSVGRARAIVRSGLRTISGASACDYCNLGSSGP